MKLSFWICLCHVKVLLAHQHVNKILSEETEYPGIKRPNSDSVIDFRKNIYICLKLRELRRFEKIWEDLVIISNDFNRNLNLQRNLRDENIFWYPRSRTFDMGNPSQSYNSFFMDSLETISYSFGGFKGDIQKLL